MGRMTDYFGLSSGGPDPRAEIAALRRRVDTLEATLAAVCERTGVTPPPPAPGSEGAAERDPRLRELLAAGKKIHAIKRYRELTGAGLKEAKDAVDALDRRYGGGSPGPWLG